MKNKKKFPLLKTPIRGDTIHDYWYKYNILVVVRLCFRVIFSRILLVTLLLLSIFLLFSPHFKSNQSTLNEYYLNFVINPTKYGYISKSNQEYPKKYPDLSGCFYNYLRNVYFGKRNLISTPPGKFFPSIGRLWAVVGC